jgi:hypothetical protein
MGTGVGEAMLIGAVTGAGTSAITGGDPLKGALFGAVGGAVMPGIGSSLGGAPTAAAAEGAALSSATAANTAATAAQQNALSQGLSQTAADNAFRQTYMDKVIPVDAIKTAPQTGFMDIFKPGIPTGDSTQRDIGQRVGDYIVQNPRMAAAIGGGAPAFFLNRPEVEMPGDDYDSPLKRFRYNPDTFRPSFAEGGITDLDIGTSARLSPSPVTMMASGGISDLGGYSDGGRLLKGPGDGMSDSIPARIGRRQPARLADGEFVVPADVVSHLGNGSTDAGAKKLYDMMDKVRRARTGNKKQGREINPRKYIPA